MKQANSQVAFYPTPAPAMQEELITQPLLEGITCACEHLYEPRGTLTSEQREEIYQHFDHLFRLMNSSYHLELLLTPGKFDWTAFWQSLQKCFPNFAWLRCQTEEPKYGRQVYRFDFVPMALNETDFPYSINLEESLTRMYALSAEEALKQAEQKLLELAQQHFSTDSLEVHEETDESPDQEETADHRVQDETTDHQVQEVSELQELVKNEGIHQESQSKARLRAVNQKLEMVIEKLELSMFYSGIKYFDQSHKEESDWDKRLTISLREYTYLLQKARFLEQMWQLNGELVNKTEKMTVTGNKLVYERDQGQFFH